MRGTVETGLFSRQVAARDSSTVSERVRRLKRVEKEKKAKVNRGVNIEGLLLGSCDNCVTNCW